LGSFDTRKKKTTAKKHKNRFIVYLEKKKRESAIVESPALVDVVGATSGQSRAIDPAT
jgi:hypothetical protein